MNIVNNKNGRLRIFVASPSDVSEERDIVSIVVAEIRRMFEQLLPIYVETIRWETHTWPDVGEDAQDVINREIGEYDIFVGIMWQRFGTPTKRARSGTDEEFQRAYEFFKKYGRPKVMFYFRRTPFYTTDLKKLTQFRKVIQFRKELEKLGVLFWEYETPLNFERSVREHLIRRIISLAPPNFIKEPEPSHPSDVPPPTKATPIIESKALVKRPKVFIAYSHADRAEVSKIYNVLRIADFDPWLDIENLMPGQMWHKEIDNAIKDADAIVLCLSTKSVSKKGFFQKELKTALDIADMRTSEGIFLIPVRLDQVNIPGKIGMFQSIDYFLQDGSERLISVLKRLAQREVDIAEYGASADADKPRH